MPNTTYAILPGRVGPAVSDRVIHNYVLGFALGKQGRDQVDPYVLLIRKEKPEWQAGKMNGVGGKIEPGESPQEAMMREFEEEVGIKSTYDDWRLFASLQQYLDIDRTKNIPAHVFCFVSRTLDINAARQKESEAPYIMPTDSQTLSYLNTVPNLRWLIPMAIHSDTFFQATITI